MSQWKTVDRPGYAGAQRDERRRRNDETYGAENWRTAWEVEGTAIEKPEAIQLYEDAYFEFLKAHPDVLKQLLEEASDVYDDAPSNVDSGLDYAIQETDRTHLQDIAIRRSVKRLDKKFMGSDLIQIRDSEGEHPLSMTLSPGRVPFHKPELIKNPRIEGWWDRDSVEDFYQSNKVLQARE